MNEVNLTVLTQPGVITILFGFRLPPSTDNLDR